MKDLETIQKKLDLGMQPQTASAQTLPEKEMQGQDNADMQAANQTCYQNIEDFNSDVKLIFQNARIYNQQDTIYYKYANQLEQLVKPMLNRLLKLQQYRRAL